jgi:hypothetical protein
MAQKDKGSSDFYRHYTFKLNRSTFFVEKEIKGTCPLLMRWACSEDCSEWDQRGPTDLWEITCRYSCTCAILRNQVSLQALEGHFLSLMLGENLIRCPSVEFLGIAEKCPSW